MDKPATEDVEEWKKELTKKCDDCLETYKSMHNHIDSLNALGNEVDIDEIGAFIYFKLLRLMNLQKRAVLLNALAGINGR